MRISETDRRSPFDALPPTAFQAALVARPVTPAEAAARLVEVHEAAIQALGERLDAAPAGRVASPSAAACEEEAAFLDEVAGIAERRGVRASSLVAVMGYESNLSATARNKTSHATGLIQFMPQLAANMLGLPCSRRPAPLVKTATPEHRDARATAMVEYKAAMKARGEAAVTQLAGMTRREQLPLVDKYLASQQKAFGKLETEQDIYMSVFMPSAVGKGEDHVLGKAEARAGTFVRSVYNQNAGLDADKDGQITAGEAASVVARNVERHPNLQRMMAAADARQDLLRAVHAATLVRM